MNKKLKSYKESIKREVKTFNRLNFKLNTHPNLVQILDVYKTPKNMYIVMELCGNKEVLYDKIR